MQGTRPTLIIVSGPPGSGKSTLARQLSQHLGLPHCARDTIKQGQIWHDTSPIDTPQDANLACNQAFRDIVSRHLQHGVSHVCDAAFQHHVWQPFLATWHTQAHIKVIICHIDEPLRLQRLHQRLAAEPQRSAAHADAAYLHNISQHSPFQVLTTAYPTLVVDTQTPTYAPAIDAITTWVRLPIQ